jgi:hypothetical protein
MNVGVMKDYKLRDLRDFTHWFMFVYYESMKRNGLLLFIFGLGKRKTSFFHVLGGLRYKVSITAIAVIETLYSEENETKIETRQVGVHVRLIIASSSTSS